MDCSICARVEGDRDFVLEDEHVVVERLEPDEAAAVGRAATRTARALQAAAGAEHVYAAVIGHHSPHFHLHVIARYPGTPREYWCVRVDEWPDAPRGDAQAIAGFCGRLRACA
jgi:histidine triad (HIT) family protein